MPSINPELVKLLQHFGSFASMTILKPGQPVCASSDTRTVYAMADVQVDEIFGERFEEGLAISDIAELNSTIKLFSDITDYDVSIVANYLMFESAKFKQRMYLSEPSLIIDRIPKPDKMQAYFAMATIAELDITVDDLTTFLRGAKNARANTVSFIGDGENVSIVASSVDDSGNSEDFGLQFEYATETTSSVEFRAGIRSDALVMLPGDYHVGIGKNFATFKGKTVSYLLPLLTWSEVNA